MLCPTPVHFHQTNLSSVTVTSPLAVDFRGFVARQSPHIVHRQAGRLVGLQRQWGEPVQSQKWEEASVVNWVLVPEIEKKKDMKMCEMSKSAGSQRGAMLGEQALIGRPRTKWRLCSADSMKGESCPQCLNSNLHGLHKNLREQRKNIKGSLSAGICSNTVLSVARG